MDKYKVSILVPAARDLENIAEFHLKEVGPQSAEKITDKILDTYLLLEQNPLMGTLHSDSLLRKQGFRKLICGNYVSVYKVIDSDIFIYRIFHGSTNYPSQLHP